MTLATLTPADHLDWFDDNVRWFADLDVSSYALAVPNCPGWDVEKVITHLAIGLGLAYPYGMAKAPEAVAGDAFSDVPWPSQTPTGSAARQYFVAELGRCVETMRTVEPTLPCWTYAGPGVAAFWFRRAAIETTLHRFDVAAALDSAYRLEPERAIDAVHEAVAFALPLAATMTGAEPDPLRLVCEGSNVWLQLGEGEPRAEIAGPADSILMALWGRQVDGLATTGEAAVAEEWLSLVERAFAGR